MSVMPGVNDTYFHGNYGYPYRGSPRRVAPTVLGVVHITGNKNLPSALAEVQYSARAGSGASFTFCVNRNGTIVQALHPETQTPWTNGDINRPNTAISTVRDMAARVGRYNPNELCFITVECVGEEFTAKAPITDAQVAALGRIFAWGHQAAKAKGWNLPIDSVRIIAHGDINSVTRNNCPTQPGNRRALLNRVVAAANPSQPNLGGDDIVDARPGTFHRRSGYVSLRAGTTYNAFRYTGKDKAGKPILLRLNDVVYPRNTSASIIGLAHWDEGVAEADCYLITPYADIGKHGYQAGLIYWSKNPAPAPRVTWDEITKTVTKDPNPQLQADLTAANGKLAAARTARSNITKGRAQAEAAEAALDKALA